MDAGIIAGMKANVVIADSGLSAASRLAGITGADDVVLPAIARALDGADLGLMCLYGGDAQKVIGPGVNFAWGAHNRVGALKLSVESGAMPTVSSIQDILTSVRQLSERVEAVA
jgi:hypothetical protein